MGGALSGSARRARGGDSIPLNMNKYSPSGSIAGPEIVHSFPSNVTSIGGTGVGVAVGGIGVGVAYKHATCEYEKPAFAAAWSRP